MAQRLKQLWQEKRLFVILSGSLLLLAVLMIGLLCFLFVAIRPFRGYDKIMPNVYCAGVDLGGMTKEQACQAIEDALKDTDYSVTLRLPDVSYEICPDQEGLTLNSAAVARRAYDYLRQDNSAYGLYKAYHQAEQTEYLLDARTELVYSRDDIQKRAREIYEETKITPTESTASFDREKHTVTLTLGKPGREIAPETIEEAVEYAFLYLDFSEIVLDYTTVEIDKNALKALTETCAKDYSSDPVEPEVVANEETHSIDVTIGQPGYTMEAETLYRLAETEMESGSYGSVSLELKEVTPSEVDIVEAYHTLACEPVEPYYESGRVQEGRVGYGLDWEMAVSRIMNSSWGDFLSIPMTELPPERTALELQEVLFRDKLSSYSSPHTVSANRTNNLTLACRAINGTVINAGGTFSFNGVVGQRTAEKGYKEATVYVGNDSVGEIGGGICQVASTIYDAALYANLEITNRAPHTFFVTYVPGGLDATVYWGSQDFCFRNNTDYPIRIDASVSGGYVHIAIYGTKVNNNYVKLDSKQISSTPYSTIREYDNSLPSGTSKETVSPYTGYVYEAYQYVYDGSGNLLKTNYLGKSTYKKRDRVVTIGTG